MFEVSLQNAKVFKNCVDAIVTLIDEGEFQLTENGLVLRAMDPSQIAMVDFILPKSAFETYDVSEMKIGINFEDLDKVVSRVRADEKLHIKLDDSKSRLILTFKGKSTRKFVVPLLDLASNSPKTPNIDFEAEMKFNSNFLKESLKDTQLVSSHVVLSATDESFLIEAQGDKGEVNILTEKNNDQVIEYNLKNSARAMFPLEYLNDLLKSADSSTNVEIGLRTDAPLKLGYKIGDASIMYYLAPRIETQ